jgi:O-antigen ligase
MPATSGYNLAARRRQASILLMSTMATLSAKAPDRRALEPLADWLAVAVAVSLPWSTTATGILVALWILAVLPSMDFSELRRQLLSAAGGLPVLLWALATVGLFWADVAWNERLGGYTPFLRLLAIPLLLAQFRRSEHGIWAFVGFFASVTGVLLLSWLLVLFPGLPWHTKEFGVPVKDYILQSDEFLMSAVVLFSIAFDMTRAGRWRPAAGLLALGAVFLAHIVFVATGRTTLLVAPVLFLFLGWRQLRWKGLLAGGIVLCLVGTVAALESPYLRARLNTSVNELHDYESRGGGNSTGLHIELLKRSIAIFRTAPVIGHGTGSIPQQFRDAAIGKSGISSIAGANPHDQILAIGIQLGSVGVAMLLAMWVAHLLLFRGGELISWIGLVIVTENVVSSLVNSHLFDFTQAWLYIFGVGVAGGTALGNRDRSAKLAAAAAGGMS